MTSTDIYSILQSKPHNPHYLNRYWKFIQYHQRNPSTDEYTEEHHICPKASDMFPEYTSFRLNPWNKIRLSLEQHLLAHLMLWKAYGGSQSYSIHYMVNVAGDKKSIPGKFVRQYSLKLKLEARKQRKGTAVYKDKEGNKFLLKTDDPRIKTEDLVGILSGHKMKEESKENMRRAKDHSRKITMYFILLERTININDPILPILIDYGWTSYKPTERFEYFKEPRTTAAREAMNGKNRFYHMDGTYYGMIEKNDPIISELGLVHIRSDKQKSQAAEQARKNAQNKEMQLRKGKTMSTRKWFHNPETNENKRLLTCPYGWKEGRSQSDISNKDKEFWNDGLKNYMLNAGEKPQQHWIKGMKPRSTQITKLHH